MKLRQIKPLELENFGDGVVLKILVEAGGQAPVGQPMLIVGEEGEAQIYQRHLRQKL